MEDIKNLTLDQYMELRKSEEMKFMQEVLWISEHRPDIVEMVEQRRAVEIGRELGIRM